MRELSMLVGHASSYETHGSFLAGIGGGVGS